MGRPKTNYLFGLDLGNGNLKIVGNAFEQRIPSIHIPAPEAEALGNITINGKSYIVGHGAQQSLSAIPTVEDKSLKVEGIERLYYGGLSYVPQLSSKIQSYPVVSSHAWATHKEEIKANLNGTKTVVLAGKTVEVTTRCLLVVPEGFGAIVERSEKLIATLDFGTGTTLITPYINKKPMRSTQAQNGGVHNLYLMISEGMNKVNFGYRGDVREIRKSLELGVLKVGDVEIKETYNEQLKKWWNDCLKDVRLEAERLHKDGYTILCIGGGAALPGLASMLKRKKFEVVTDKPELASARGLYQLAIKEAKKNGISTVEAE
ncbi:hypothetical protein NIES4106_61730 (plasmid) [Fischerella sp. NIES-4106]|nr:hypothetical protein NIES4106_61730 [Fischerella sp. NIES-4106]